jgi:hypothetical protein
MKLLLLAPDLPGMEQQTFQCVTCKHVENRVVSAGTV